MMWLKASIAKGEKVRTSLGLLLRRVELEALSPVLPTGCDQYQWSY